MNRLLAIDPGATESAWVLLEIESRRPLLFGKVENDDLRVLLATRTDFDLVAIEMIASYGMPVGAEVFDTCVNIGRYVQILAGRGIDRQLVYRKTVKLHHCGSAKAKDTNIRQALVDRFAYGQKNNGKGTKAQPGWFYGFAADVWAAYAVAVWQADQVTL